MSKAVACLGWENVLRTPGAPKLTPFSPFSPLADLERDLCQRIKIDGVILR